MNERKRLRRESVISAVVEGCALLGGGYLWCLLAGLALKALGLD